MAVNVSNDFRPTVYSGGALYKCYLYIGEERIMPSQISSITIYRPIIDTEQKTFYIGTFISDKIEVVFRNIDNLNINSGDEAELNISLMVNGQEELVNCGTFIIDDLGEDYYKKNKITALDDGIKFAEPVDTPIEDVFDYDSETDTYSISLEDLLIWLCSHYGVTLGTYPNTNKNVRVGNWDSTISGKRYVSWIAEMMAGNVKIGRDRTLNIRPLKSNPVATINAKKGKSLVIGEKYKITGVTYFDAVRNYTRQSGTDEGNVLIIRQENLFVTSQEDIDNIYDAVENLEIYSMTTENYGDISLDAFDIVTYQVGEDSYNTFYNSTLTYKTSIMAKVDTQIPTKQQEVTTNIKQATPATSVRKVQTEVDSVNGRVNILAEEVDTNSSSISNLEITSNAIQSTVSSLSTQVNDNYTEVINKFDEYAPNSRVDDIQTSVNNIQTNTYTKTEIQQIANGTGVDGVKVTAVVSTEATFDKDGMHYRKTDAPTESLINQSGLGVYGTSNDDELLYAGYDDDQTSSTYGSSIVRTQNLTVSTYLNCGGNGRFESYEDSNGHVGVGFFLT